MSTAFQQLAFAAAVEGLVHGRAWSRLVTKHGVAVQRDDVRRGYHVLHATKGWRFISDRRLALG